MGPLTKLKAILQSNHASITKPRIRVFEILAGSESPLTTRQIHTLAKDLDKVSVYRTIELFETIGVTRRVWNGFKSSIELSDEFSAHHHHFTCSICGTIETIKSEPIEALILELEEKYGFSLNNHTVELSGTCKNCLASGQPRTPQEHKH
jgi:Fe2+ or Zn2+ uptake regulation protein